MATFVVGSCREMLAIRGDLQEELVVQCVLLELVRQVALQVIRNLG